MRDRITARGSRDKRDRLRLEALHIVLAFVEWDETPSGEYNWAMLRHTMDRARRLISDMNGSYGKLREQ